MRRRDVLAGALAVNAIPHTVVGFVGGRCRTPLRGEDSGPVANLVWAAANLTSAGIALASGTSVRGDQKAIDDRRRAVQIGCTLMTAFGVAYETRVAVRGHRARSRR